jgi:hypothetical protein
MKALDKVISMASKFACDDDDIERVKTAMDELEALQRAAAKSAVTDDLVQRFLSWPLPSSVCSDLCVTAPNYPYPRSGTNLLTATEARAMLEHVLGTASREAV